MHQSYGNVLYTYSIIVIYNMTPWWAAGDVYHNLQGDQNFVLQIKWGMHIRFIRYFHHYRSTKF